MVRKYIYFGLIACVYLSSTNTLKENENIVKVNKENIVINNKIISELNPKMVLSNKVEILLPQYFFELNDSELISVYPNAKRRPDIVFVNEDRTVHISFQHTFKRASLSELPKILEQLTAQYANIPSVELINSKIENINGLDYVSLEYTSQGDINRIYNLMLITAIESKVMMSAFTCAMPVINDWKDIGSKVLKSQKL